MKATVSPSTRRRYPLTMICQVWRAARSSVYATGAPLGRPTAPRKRGPKTAVSDAELLGAIRDILQATPFHGEGYRKVRARLAHRGLAVSGKRVMRLMSPASAPGAAAARAAQRGSRAQRDDHHDAPGLSLVIQ